MAKPVSLLLLLFLFMNYLLIHTSNYHLPNSSATVPFSFPNNRSGKVTYRESTVLKHELRDGGLSKAIKIKPTKLINYPTKNTVISKPASQPQSNHKLINNSRNLKGENIAVNPARYLSLTITRQEGDINTIINRINSASRVGLNTVEITVNQKTDNNNWSTLDQIILNCLSKNMKVAFRIYFLETYITNGDECNSNFASYQNWMKGYIALDNTIKPHHTFTGGELYRERSLSDDAIIESRKNFVQALMEHFNANATIKNAFTSGNILFITHVNTPTQEFEYYFGNSKCFRREVEALFDYSESMINKYRSWLKTKYLNDVNLRNAWGNSSVSLSTVIPKIPQYGIFKTAFLNGQDGKDWFQFRTYILKTYSEEISASIRHNLDNVLNAKEVKIINSHGSVFDDLSLRRGTYAFKSLIGSNIDGVKVNDAPHYNSRFSMDLLRSNVGTNKWIMNEIGYEPGINTEKKQIIESFDSGAILVSLMNIDFNKKQDVETIDAEVLSKLKTPVPVITPATSYSVNLSDIINNGYDNYIKPIFPANVTLLEDYLVDNAVSCVCSVGISASNNQICNGQFVSLTANVTAPDLSTLNYKWSNGETGSIINVSSPGTYTVTVSLNGRSTVTNSINITGCSTASSNCETGINYPTAPRTYAGAVENAGCGFVSGWTLDMENANHPVAVDIYIDGYKIGSALPNKGDGLNVATLYNNEQAKPQPFNFMFPSGMWFSNGVNRVVTVKYSGTSTVINNYPVGSTKIINCSEKGSGTCTGSSSIIGNDKPASDEVRNTLLIYPNKVNRNINYTFNSKADLSGKAIVEIYDIKGHRFYNEEVGYSDKEITGTIMTENLPAGEYIIRMKTNMGAYSKRFIKE